MGLTNALLLIIRQICVCSGKVVLKTSSNNILCTKSVPILKTFHFVPKSTYVECQWNLSFYNFHSDMHSLVAMKTVLLGKLLENVGYERIL